jgi:hypothetical protein
MTLIRILIGIVPLGLIMMRCESGRGVHVKLFDRTMTERLGTISKFSLEIITSLAAKIVDGSKGMG